MRQESQYIILKWLDELPGFPPYSFATIQHAQELCARVEWLQQCASMAAAARLVTELNRRHGQPGPGDAHYVMA